MASDKAQRWLQAVAELEKLYSEVEHRCYTLPWFSVYPFLSFSWMAIKFYLSIYADILFVVPINVVILIRNFFPGRWAYHAFTARYFRAIFRWIRNGEDPVLPSFALRPLALALLNSHFNSRLLTVKRAIVIEYDLDKSNRTQILSEVERLLLQWPAKTVGHFVGYFFSHILPLLPPLASLLGGLLNYESIPDWAPVVTVLLFVSVLGFVLSSYIVKRGVMLGGEGRSTYYPGFIEGNGAYGRERNLLAEFGVSKDEFPLAFAITLVNIPAALLFLSPWFRPLLSYVMPGRGGYNSFNQAWISSMASMTIVLVLNAVALYRRRKLGR